MSDRELTPAELIKNRIQLKTWLDHETKRMNEYFAPVAKQIEEIDNQLLSMLNEQGCESFKSEHGTAYKSTIMNVKVENRDDLIDAALEHWDEFGNELLLVSAQKDTVKQYMESHKGALPPGLSISYFTRVNIRRT
jgi:hypothetical protein